MDRLELTEGQQLAATSAGHAAALMIWMSAGDALAGAPREGAELWFAGGDVLPDRDQDADLHALGAYAAAAARLGETLWRRACDLGIVAGEPDAFDAQGAELRLAYDLFADTVRTAAALIAEQAARDTVEPVVEPAERKVEDSIFERSDADGGQDAAHVAGLDHAAAHRAQAGREAAETEALGLEAALEQAKPAGDAKPATPARPRKADKLARPKSERSKGRTKAERLKGLDEPV